MLIYFTGCIVYLLFRCIVFILCLIYCNVKPLLDICRLFSMTLNIAIVV